MKRKGQMWCSFWLFSFSKCPGGECSWMPMFPCHVLSACCKTLMPGSWYIEIKRSR